jgi:hypothetical protein
MDKSISRSAFEALIEKLADKEHERWSHWQQYLHSQCEQMEDGSLLIPPELVRRWEREIAASYVNLTSDEKESDREQVRNYLPVILKALDITIE